VFVVRLVVRPLGYLAFVFALGALSVAARLFGEQSELGVFSGHLARMIWRYPEVTRPCVQAVWALWALLFGLALSPVDPIATEPRSCSNYRIAALAVGDSEGPSHAPRGRLECIGVSFGGVMGCVGDV
jgi:hypothetical protein